MVRGAVFRAMGEEEEEEEEEAGILEVVEEDGEGEEQEEKEEEEEGEIQTTSLNGATTTYSPLQLLSKFTPNSSSERY